MNKQFYLRRLIKEEVQKALNESTEFKIKRSTINWSDLLSSINDKIISDKLKIDYSKYKPLETHDERGIHRVYLLDDVCITDGNNYMWAYRVKNGNYVEKFIRYYPNEIDKMIKDIIDYYNAEYTTDTN